MHILLVGREGMLKQEFCDSIQVSLCYCGVTMKQMLTQLHPYLCYRDICSINFIITLNPRHKRAGVGETRNLKIWVYAWFCFSVLHFFLCEREIKILFSPLFCLSHLCVRNHPGLGLFYYYDSTAFNTTRPCNLLGFLR